MLAPEVLTVKVDLDTDETVRTMDAMTTCRATVAGAVDYRNERATDLAAAGGELEARRIEVGELAYATSKGLDAVAEQAEFRKFTAWDEISTDDAGELIELGADLFGRVLDVLKWGALVAIALVLALT